MALSDVCFDLVWGIGELAHELAERAHPFSAPGHPLGYGQEVDAVKRAAAIVAERPYDTEAVSRLIGLCMKVARFHDTPPGSKHEAEREREMNQLVMLFQAELRGEEADGIEGAVAGIASDTPLTRRAAEHVKGLLSQLGKESYEIAVKITGDVASAAAKKMIGL